MLYIVTYNRRVSCPSDCSACQSSRTLDNKVLAMPHLCTHMTALTMEVKWPPPSHRHDAPGSILFFYSFAELSSGKFAKFPLFTAMLDFQMILWRFIFLFLFFFTFCFLS